MLAVVVVCAVVGVCLGGEGPYPPPQLQDEALLATNSPPSAPGDVPTEQLIIPKNTKIKIQDNRLQYSHGFNDDSTGTSVSEQGRLFSTNDGWEYVIIKKGSYSYTSPEGIPVTVNYVADHNGFRVIGEIHG